ncbi:MAG: bacillithiol system redox-active protein YtxJ [Sphingobacteriia bacterium]|nr:MAG: bacillithiol system redox-active protein YtxJ [Sphingobacteriia bacterium]
MEWKALNNEADLDALVAQSFQKPQLIFKHSTRCSISSMALNRMERAETPNSIDFYLLDLLQHRSLSQKIADQFQVYHESPQVLLVQKGECVYDESHQGIQMDEILSQLNP